MEIFYDIPEIISRHIIMISYILSFFSLIPQIILNYRLKSGSGISDLMLLGGLNGHCARLYYHFCARLPLIYRIVGPLSSVAFFVLIIQRFYYDRSLSARYLGAFFCFNVLFFIMILPFSVTNPYQIGTFFGWMTMPIWFFYQIPQIFKIYKTKSVAGFSFLYVLLGLVAGSSELLAAFVLHLPIITIVNDLRAIFISLLFYIQFRMYRLN